MEKLDMNEVMELLAEQTFEAMFEAMNHIGTTLNGVVDWINKHEKYVQPLEKAWKEAIEQTLEQAKKRGEHDPK